MPLGPRARPLTPERAGNAKCGGWLSEATEAAPHLPPHDPRIHSDPQIVNRAKAHHSTAPISGSQRPNE